MSIPPENQSQATRLLEIISWMDAITESDVRNFIRSIRPEIAEIIKNARPDQIFMWTFFSTLAPEELTELIQIGQQTKRAPVIHNLLNEVNNYWLSTERQRSLKKDH